MFQGIPARIVERLWPRLQVMESQQERPHDAMAHGLSERGVREQSDREHGGTHVGRLASRELFNGAEDLAYLDAVGAWTRSADARADEEAGDVTVALGRFDALVGRGLTQILSEDRDLRIIDADLDDVALEHTAARQSPHVAILDEASTVRSSVLERLRTAQPTIGIAVLAHHPTVAYAMRLMTRGASCLAKDVSAADILAAVRIVAEGRHVFADIDGHLVQRSRPVTAVSLTPREAEVMEYLARGQSHREIAHALQLGVETVRTHSAHIRAKLGVRSKRELIGLPIPLQGETGSR
jgi:DNA-binding NarL/FixJ family response regulator